MRWLLLFLSIRLVRREKKAPREDVFANLMGGNGCSHCFFNSPQNFSTRECAHRNNDTQKICIFIQRPLISIHCNNKNRQILCKLEYGRPFSVFVNLYRKTNFISIQLQKIFLFLYNLTIPI